MNSETSNIEKQLEAARRNLLDLTLRNRLLNYRPNKARSIRIIDEIPREVFDILVMNEGGMEFRPRTKEVNKDELFKNEGQTVTGESETLAEDDGMTKIWEMPIEDEEVAEHHVDRYLQTNLEPETLQKRLFYINQQARSVLEEQGYSVLFLALGFLEWKETDVAAEYKRAPLILIPVELERPSVNRAFKIRWNGDDIQPNISLQAFLQQTEYNITLPEFSFPETKSEIDEYFQKIHDRISSLPGWRIVQDVYLDFFSFTKFVMYKDLDIKSWPEEKSPLNQPLINSLFIPTSESTSYLGFSKDDIDEKLRPHDTYHIMDADPFQIEVIEDAKAGRNLVVEGPPGTGKSQTIANIIAELLAKGKSVLFVSEKMAALEVVKERLDAAGLGDFCLELHSRKTNKKDFLRELERSMQTVPSTAIELGEKFGQLSDLKNELNSYVKVLREPVGKFVRSPFALIEMKEKANRYYSKVRRKMVHFAISDPEIHDQNDFSLAVNRLTEFADIYRIVKPVKTHPWNGCYPATILPSDEEELSKGIEKCIETQNKFVQNINRLVELTGIALPNSLDAIDKAIYGAKIIAESIQNEKSVLANEAWDKQNDQAKSLINELIEVRNLIAVEIQTFHQYVLEQNIESLFEDYKTNSSRVLRFFFRKYWELKREIRSLYKVPTRKRVKAIIADLNSLSHCQNRLRTLRAKNKDGKHLFGLLWHDENSSPEELKQFSEWIVDYRRRLREGTITEKSFDIIEKKVEKNKIEESIQILIEINKEFENALDGIASKLNLNYGQAFGCERNQISLPDFVLKFKKWKNAVLDLQRWAQYIALCKSVEKTIAKPMLEVIESDTLAPEEIVYCFQDNFADSLLRYAMQQRPQLANFIGELHEKKITRFAELDRELIKLNSQRLRNTLYKSRPQILGGASQGSEAGIVLGEFGRKRGHMPIRQLMIKAGGLIQKIKSCFMMSPLSIAQFLDPRTIDFDVIIFDEASQVKPEDALGALLRGRQLVVMGDTRQLPPTTFFDHIIEEGEYNELESAEASIAEIESILHQCKRSFPTKLLSWHYRSKHESLITISNREFYDNRLLTFPSSIDKDDYLGLHFVHLPDAIYDRGRSRTNRKEARTVAIAALEHYKKYPDKSLGIGAFNIKQQEAILEEVELQLRLHPVMEDFFRSDRNEHFFVKNLETIQGDERDVIFISITYGFDETGKLTTNFGPLNQEGGQRRLNVLITRAKERCVVFSNFRDSDLQIAAGTPFGVKALKSFLSYAENRNLLTFEPGTEDTDSPFEDAVYEFLRDNGYEVKKQVGCAAFRIDLAVVDQKNRGRYLIGIECDGAKYHTSPVARDRDRLRQQMLESLGWRIHRVWSTDWYRNRKDSEKRILDAIKKVKLEPNVFYHNVSRRNVQEPPKENGKNSIGNQTSTNNLLSIPQLVQEYQRCQSLNIRRSGEIYRLPTVTLARAIVNVVDVEWPIHFEEVVRRIRSLWGLFRSGERIYDAIKMAVSYAVRERLLRKRGEFLWPIDDRPIRVKRRMDDPPPRIEIICSAEISEAVRIILRHQFATPISDLIIQTARLLGFHAVHEQTGDEIRKIINRMINTGELQKMVNGMIYFSDDSVEA